MRLRQLMTENFSLIGESSSIGEARSKLSSDDYLVVTSDEGLPLTVITMADLPGNGLGGLRGYIPKLPPTVIIGCDMSVSSIHDAPTGYLFRNKARGAALLGERGVVGVVPVKLIRSYLKESPSKSEIPPGTLDRRRQPKERIIPFSFEISRIGNVGAHPIRYLRVAAAGTLGGSRVVPVVPRLCRKCGWADFYDYILSTTKCKNPDKTVQPQPWPHTLA